MNKAVLRIIDANMNRSREGLRVCEEIARFVLASGVLTKELKAIRHGISAITERGVNPRGLFLKYRDSENDIGRTSRFKSETVRHGCADIFAANLERVKESLRVLEEFFKLVDKGKSNRFKALRFRVYDIEKRSAKRIASLSDI